MQEIKRCKKPGLPERVRTDTQAVLCLAWGGPQGLAKATETEPFATVFRRSEKSPGGRQAKGWETAETAAAEVGAWREACTAYPPLTPTRF